MKKLGKLKRKQLIKIAKELFYDKKVIEQLEKAETEEEADKIMMNARLSAN